MLRSFRGISADCFENYELLKAKLESEMNVGWCGGAVACGMQHP